MLWDKIHVKQIIGDMGHKVPEIVNRDFISTVTASLIIYLGLSLSGCVTKNAEETLIEKKNYAVSQPKMLEVTVPKKLEVSQPQSLKVSEPKSLKVSEPKSLEPSSFDKGKYSPAERKNPAYDHCAKVIEFDERLKCVNEALGITQE